MGKAKEEEKESMIDQNQELVKEASQAELALNAEAT